MVGRKLAAALGMRFLDTDSMIEASTGTSIAEIFATQGEQAFRKLERDTITGLVEGPPCIVATGGGTPINTGVMDLMRSRGVVVSLTATLDQLLARANGSKRPLLAQSRDQLAALLAAREPIYQKAHFEVDTGDRRPADVAAELEQLVANTAGMSAFLSKSVWVQLGERSYPIIVEAGGLSRIGQLTKAVLPNCSRIGIVADTNVEPHYGETVRSALKAAGYTTTTVVVPAGEQSKSMSQYAKVCEDLVAAGLDRSSAILALGGGVVGDLAGFCRRDGVSRYSVSTGPDDTFSHGRLGNRRQNRDRFARREKTSSAPFGSRGLSSSIQTP